MIHNYKINCIQKLFYSKNHENKVKIKVKKVARITLIRNQHTKNLSFFKVAIFRTCQNSKLRK